MDAIKLFEETTDFDSVLVTSQENRLYFSGFTSTYGYLILTKTEGLFLTDHRYLLEARSIILDKHITVEVASDDVYNQIRGYLTSKGLKKLAIEEDHLTFNEYNTLKEKMAVARIDIVGLKDKISILRSIKSESEIELISKAQSFTEAAFSAVIPMLKSNVSERDIAIELEYQMRIAGATGIAFDTIVAFGENTAKPHAVPSNRKLKNGELVLMDFGAKYNGYCSDMTRTLAFGNVDEQLVKIYDIVLQAQNTALKNGRAGMTALELDSFAREYIMANGFSKNFTHSLGHGVGLNIHEEPRISYKNADTILRENMVITIEPGIYVDGLGGVRIENMAVVKKDGLQNLTKTNREFKRI